MKRNLKQTHESAKKEGSLMARQTQNKWPLSLIAHTHLRSSHPKKNNTKDTTVENTWHRSQLPT